MYGIALSVAACLRGGTRVDVAWNLDTDAAPRFDPAESVGITPGGGRLGTLLGGALDSRLIELAAAKPTRGRLLRCELNNLEAAAVGVAAGTALRLMVVPADALPAGLWEALSERREVRLVAELEGDAVGAIRLDDPCEADAADDRTTITTTWRPRTSFVVAGSGPMADALAGLGELMGWNVEPAPGPEAAIGLAATLSGIDGVVVVGHDIEAAGRVLQAALGSETGYVGSVGPASIQAARLDWLAYRGVATERLSAPAGIDIGARTPPEVAISVVAQMIGTLAAH